MSDDLMLDVGLASEIKLAARKAGCTGADLKALATGDMMARILPVLRNEAEVVMKDGKVKPVPGNAYLRRLYADQQLVIGVTDGHRTIASATDVFAYIDSDFKNWGLNKRSADQLHQPIAVFELVKDARFSEFFPSIGKPLEKLSFTQSQVIEICKTKRDKLRGEGYANFFLIEEGGEFFVAHVFVRGDGGLEVDVSRFGGGLVCHGVYRLRVIVPATAL